MNASIRYVAETSDLKLRYELRKESEKVKSDVVKEYLLEYTGSAFADCFNTRSSTSESKISL